MRFAARLAIAIATLLSSAILCWGQTPRMPASGAAMRASAIVAARRGAEPDSSPPQSVEGAWVADDDSPPTTYDRTQEANDLPAFESNDGQPGYGDEACECDEDGYGGHPGRYFHDLWSDVHAHRRIWVQSDFLYFWSKGNPLPPLVTTSPLGTPQTQAGVLPVSATTQILFGDGRVDTQPRNGGRLNFGYWLVDGEFIGVEGQYFTFQQTQTKFDAASNFTNDPNSQILARPFVNYDPILPSPQNSAALVAFPNFIKGNQTSNLDGSVGVHTNSNVQSASALMRRLIWIDFTSGRRLDVIAGYRFFRLDDSVTINDSTESTFSPFGHTILTSQDQFSARNQFHGGEIGLKGQSYHGRLSIELLGKVAFGNNTERMHINGSNALTVVGTGISIVNSGGLLTQTSNIGDVRRDVFAILPEANTNLRWDLTKNLRATLGYNFIYINRVQRSGDAIDLGLNPTQINGNPLIGAARPAFSFHDTSFWMHGVNAGFEYRW